MYCASSAFSDVGQRRKNNEDYFICDDAMGLYIVCDGVGGHACGEVASQEAAQTAARYLKARAGIIDAFDGSADAKTALRNLVADAVRDASEHVAGLASSESGRADMGTTMTLLLILGDTGVMGHAGDSRLYVARNERIHQLSEDHTVLNELISRGEIPADAPPDLPCANMLTRVVGQKHWLQVDTLTFDVFAGDTYLVCSDGLTHYFDDDVAELGQHLCEADDEHAAEALVGIANQRGGRDNITAVIVRAVRQDEPEELDHTIDMSSHIEMLAHVGLFAQLSHAELLHLQFAGELRNASQGDVIISEGDTGDEMFVLLDGRLTVSRRGQAVATLETGTHFGEMALISERRRSATVHAVEDAAMLVIGRTRFTELVQAEPALGVKLLWGLSHELVDRLDTTTELLATRQPRRRTGSVRRQLRPAR